MQYFDSLVHVTTDGRWFDTNHDASVNRLIRAMEAVQPARACVAGTPGHNISNDFIREVCRQYRDRLIPIAGCNPREFSSARDAHKKLMQWAGEGFLGVKLHPRFSETSIDEDCVDWVMDAAAQVGLPVFLCTILQGILRTSPARPVDLIDQLLLRHPETDCVLLHGATTDLLACADLVRLHRRALLDLSFTILKYRDSSLDLDLRYVLQSLDQRCTVGSDFPEFLPDQAKQRVSSLMAGLPVEKIENVMYRNLANMIGDDREDMDPPYKSGDLRLELGRCVDHSDRGLPI